MKIIENTALKLVIAIGMWRDFQPAYQKVFLSQITCPAFN